MPDYHDVVVIVNGKEYRIADNYAYHLTCTKCGGWNLWYKWFDKECLIGGEFEGDEEFIIKVGDTIICRAMKYDEEQDELVPITRVTSHGCKEEIGEGWNGRVDTDLKVSCSKKGIS